MGNITKDMTIGNIFEEFPEHAMKLAEVMQSYGLHCVGCHANVFDTLENGVMIHGMPEEKLSKMVSELNKVLEEKKEVSDGINLTKRAADVIKKTLKDEKKSGAGIRVSVIGCGCAGETMNYSMDIEEKENGGDAVFEQDGIKLFVDKQVLSKLNGTEVDYVNVAGKEGFSFSNPNLQGSERRNSEGILTNPNKTGGCGCGH